VINLLLSSSEMLIARTQHTRTQDNMIQNIFKNLYSP